MEIDKYKELENRVREKTFAEKFSKLKIGLNILTYFGHITCIFLAFFMLKNLLLNGIFSNVIIASIISVIILAGIEIFKRELVYNSSTALIKGDGKKVIPLLLVTIGVLGISFFTSLTGAREYSNKSEHIENVTDSYNSRYADSINTNANATITKLESAFAPREELLSELQTLSINGKLTRDQRNIVNNITEEKKQVLAEIASIRKEASEKIQKYEAKIGAKSERDKSKNNTNSIIFVLLSSIIESSIIFGLWFGQYYDRRSYKEMKFLMENDPEYKKLALYKALMDVIYTEDFKVNSKLPSYKSIIELARVNGVLILNTELQSFIKMMLFVGNVKQQGSVKYIIRDKESAWSALRATIKIPN